MNNAGPARTLLADLLTPKNIVLDLKGSQRDDVLRELVAQIQEIAQQPESQQTLLKALQEREQLHSTGIGDGVALPHARNALVGVVERPVVVFGRHLQGLAYGAIDGKPAHLFFLLVAPNVTQHLQLLARLSRVLRDPRVRQGLLAADRPQRVIALLQEAESAL
jgi:mannitol/fructose-specific phosphotransferase system IIA component (Ntr-type)